MRRSSYIVRKMGVACKAGLGAALGLLVWASAAPACELASSETVRVAHVVDAVSYELSDGRTLRLEGLGPPRAPSRYDGAWPMMEEAAEAARAILSEGSLGIAPTHAPDRYGRIVAQAFLADGTWVNGALVSAGLVRVETTRDQRRRGACP